MQPSVAKPDVGVPQKINIFSASEIPLAFHLRCRNHPHQVKRPEQLLELKEVAADALAPKITFRQDGREGSTGIGKDSSLAVVPGRWAAQFKPPYELWIFDGTDKLQLYERTTEPKGFKSSSSSIVPSLQERAPDEIKKLMQTAAEQIK